MLKQTIERYLEIRRAAGFELKVDAGLLRGFARFSMDRSETCVRRQSAIDWAAKAPSPSQQERRLGMVRRFADHARAEDPGHEIVPRNVFANSKRRRARVQYGIRQARCGAVTFVQLSETRSI